MIQGHRPATAALLLGVSIVGVGAPAYEAPRTAPGPPRGGVPQQTSPMLVDTPERDVAVARLDVADPDAWGMALAFEDNFDGVAPDRSRWSIDGNEQLEQRTMANNGERQVYFDPDYLGLGVRPVTVGGGRLTITAAPLTPHAHALVMAELARRPPAVRDGVLKTLAYSSGRIATLHRFEQTYGYFEARLRFSAGKGLWPAFWLLPADGSWPPEIDVMEVLGHQPSRVHMTVHSQVAEVQRNEGLLPPDDGDFHRYGVLWTPERIDFYLDGVHAGSARTPADAHRPMYMILNLAVGGYWPGSPDDGTTFPATLAIDYVRAWRFRTPPGRR